MITAAAAKSLQSCLTLRDPIDSSPPDSSVSGILQVRILEWVAICNHWDTMKDFQKITSHSALAPSFEKPLHHESEVEEKANAQAEAQKKKDEAEVRVNLHTHGSHRSRKKGSQRPGTPVQTVDCMPTI